MIKLKILYADEFLYNIEREKPPKPRLFENSQILNMCNDRAMRIAEKSQLTIDSIPLSGSNESTVVIHQT